MEKKKKYLKPETSVLETRLGGDLMDYILSYGGDDNPTEAESKRQLLLDEDDWNDDGWGDLWEE